MLKQIHKSIATPLAIIFNKSLTEGKFPDLMKLADIVPIHKSKERYLTTNYSINHCVQATGESHIQKNLLLPQQHRTVIPEPVWF